MFYKISFLLFLPNLRYWTLLPSDNVRQPLYHPHILPLKIKQENKKTGTNILITGDAKEDCSPFLYNESWLCTGPFSSRLKTEVLTWPRRTSSLLLETVGAALGRKVCRQHWWLLSLRQTWKQRLSLHCGWDKGPWVATKSYGSSTSPQYPFFSFIQESHHLGVNKRHCHEESKKKAGQ